MRGSKDNENKMTLGPDYNLLISLFRVLSQYDKMLCISQIRRLLIKKRMLLFVSHNDVYVHFFLDNFYFSPYDVMSFVKCNVMLMYISFFAINCFLSFKLLSQTKGLIFMTHILLSYVIIMLYRHLLRFDQTPVCWIVMSFLVYHCVISVDSLAEYILLVIGKRKWILLISYLNSIYTVFLNRQLMEFSR